MPWCVPRRAEGSRWGEACIGLTGETVDPVTET